MDWKSLTSNYRYNNHLIQLPRLSGNNLITSVSVTIAMHQRTTWIDILSPPPSLHTFRKWHHTNDTSQPDSCFLFITSFVCKKRCHGEQEKSETVATTTASVLIRRLKGKRPVCLIRRATQLVSLAVIIHPVHTIHTETWSWCGTKSTVLILC